MRERLEKSLRDRVRAGARPQRADPRFARPVVLTVAQVVKACVLLQIAGGVLAVAGFAILGVRPATPADLRLVAFVRAAVPDADALSQDDLTARLQIPPELGKVLALLAATDPARKPVIRQGWLDALRGRPPAVTTPERMRALGDVASALATLPERDRTDAIKAVVDLYLATQDPASRTIIADVGALSRPQREALAASDALAPLLAAIADLPAAKQQALADGRLKILPDDPDRLRLIQSIPRLEPSAVHLINRLAGITDPSLREVLIYAIERIRSGSPEVLQLLTLYWYRDPALIAALASPSSTPLARSSHAR